jgi:hypothetical protein
MRRIRCTVWRSGWALLLAGALVVGLSACGGSDTPTSTPTPSPTPTPCTQEVIYQDNFPVPSQHLIFDQFSFPRPGRIDITVNWTFDESPMGFYLVPAGTCNTIEEFVGGACDFLIRSESGGKPRRISVANFEAGNYRWFVGNANPEADEQVSLQIVISEGSCPALAGGLPSVSAAGDPVPAIRRMVPR